MKFRKFARAVAGMFTVELASRQGEDCKSKAATPAA
jgi:hypothetical protein